MNTFKEKKQFQANYFTEINDKSAPRKGQIFPNFNTFKPCNVTKENSILIGLCEISTTSDYILI